MAPHTIICTKESYLSVMYSEYCRRTRVLYIFFIAFFASIVPVIEICINGKEVLTRYGFLFFYGFLLFFFWKIVYIKLKKNMMQNLEKVCTALPESQYRLEIGESGFTIVYNHVSASREEIKFSDISRIETINGYTTIFVKCEKKEEALAFSVPEGVKDYLKPYTTIIGNCNGRKDTLAFVATEDITNYLNELRECHVHDSTQ